MLLGPWKARDTRQTFANLASAPKKDDLATVSALLEAGKVVPVIDRCFPLNKAADAFRYLGKGHAKGKIVITAQK